MLTNIIIVRHGSTEWNEKERFRGLADISLSELGFRQAEATSAHLVDLPVNRIYSSPLRRAMQTASLIAAPHKLEPVPLNGIIDIHFGRLQGLSFEETEQKYPDIYRKWIDSPHLVTFPEGENLLIVRERSSTALNEIINIAEGETIVIVSHKVVITVLICYFLGLDNSHFRQIEQDTCAINTFNKQNDNIYAVLLNDTCHLNKVK